MDELELAQYFPNSDLRSAVSLMDVKTRNKLIQVMSFDDIKKRTGSKANRKRSMSFSELVTLSESFGGDFLGEIADTIYNSHDIFEGLSILGQSINGNMGNNGKFTQYLVNNYNKLELVFKKKYGISLSNYILQILFESMKDSRDIGGGYRNLLTSRGGVIASSYLLQRNIKYIKGGNQRKVTAALKIKLKSYTIGRVLEVLQSLGLRNGIEIMGIRKEIGKIISINYIGLIAGGFSGHGKIGIQMYSNFIKNLGFNVGEEIAIGIIDGESLIEISERLKLGKHTVRYLLSIKEDIDSYLQKTNIVNLKKHIKEYINNREIDFTTTYCREYKGKVLLAMYFGILPPRDYDRLHKLVTHVNKKSNSVVGANDLKSSVKKPKVKYSRLLEMISEARSTNKLQLLIQYLNTLHDNYSLSGTEKDKVKRSIILYKRIRENRIISIIDRISGTSKDAEGKDVFENLLLLCNKEIQRCGGDKRLIGLKRLLEKRLS